MEWCACWETATRHAFQSAVSLLS
uniref:Uncharacterized protein n=1 Tax=Anguilla anguilla TaxID=7936 RepID=A0A0E9Q6H0_ANGAN